MRQTPAILCLLLSLFTTTTYAQTGNFNLEDWPHTQAALKTLYVKAIMEQAGVHKVRFSQPAEFYSAELDKFADFAHKNNYRPYLKTSVAQNLATLAVIHCDWNNGVSPWEFAQHYLGDKQLELLRPAYGDELIKLQDNCGLPEQS